MLEFRFSERSQKATVLSTRLLFLKNTPATCEVFSPFQFSQMGILNLCYIVNLSSLKLKIRQLLFSLFIVNSSVFFSRTFERCGVFSMIVFVLFCFAFF